MSESPSREDLLGVIKYINSIKANERLTLKHLSSMSFLLWSFLFFFGGAMDYYLTSLQEEFAVVIVWFTLSIFGAIYSFFLSARERPEEQETSQDKTTFKSTSRIIVILITLMWILTIIMAFNGFDYLIMISVPLTIGLMFLFLFVKHIQSQGTRNSTLSQLLSLFISVPPMSMAFLTSIINLIILLISEELYIAFAGLLMGVLIGSGFLISGAKGYKEFSKSLKRISV
ncbi:MAG: hypothetical protein INQ03_14030 [Candidatus Heimdallarchaeota archaeon]|nr:hypothetical protein [Candidatus Heimdallarchaeota archaeon]